MNDALTSSGSDQPNRGPDSERLLALLENATEGSRELDAQVGYYAGWDNGREWRFYATKAIERGVPICQWAYADDLPAFTQSLDDALTLVPPGFQWAINAPNIEGELQFRAEVDWSNSTWAASAPLALCIAALRTTTTPKSVPSLSPTQARGASSPESSLPESNNQSETP